MADGQTFDLQGHLLTAETSGLRVSITRNLKHNLGNPDQQASQLIGQHQGKQLNSTKDLVVKSDGNV